MKNLIKRLLALNLAILLLLTAALPASAADDSAAGAVYTITIGGQTYTLTDADESPMIAIDNWNAAIGTTGDGTPALLVALNNYNGGAIQFRVQSDSDTPIGIILNCYGACAINAESGAAITMSGFQSLAIYARDEGVVTLSGQPAVDLPNGRLIFCTKDIVLDGCGQIATTAASWGRGESGFQLLTVTNEQGEVTKIQSVAADAKTVTVHDASGENGADLFVPVTLTCREGDYLDLSNAFVQQGKYIGYFTASGQEFGVRVYPWELEPGNTELFAHWVTTDYQIPVVFYGNGGSDRTTIVLDGSKEWTVPQMSGYDVTDSITGEVYHNTPLCWENNINGTITQLLPGQKMPARQKPLGFLAGYTVAENSIVFCANGETPKDSGWTIIQPVNNYQTRDVFGESESGRFVVSWNTKPDGSGTSYAVSDALVPESQTQLVWLYAQWSDVGAIPVRIKSSGVDDASEKTIYAAPGKSITLPDPGKIDGQRCTAWEVSYWTKSGEGRYESLSADAATYTIPSGASEVSIFTTWLPENDLVIDGKSYAVNASWIDYRDAAGKNTAGFRYDTVEGTAQLYLYNYNGGAIYLPASTRVTTNEEYVNTITAASGVALSCTGTIGLFTTCDNNVHGSLTIQGAPGEKAIAATGGVVANAASHTTIRAGSGGTVCDEKLKFLTGENFTYLADDKTVTSADGFLSLPAGTQTLKIEPKTFTVTIDGNGGTADGQSSLTLYVEPTQTIWMNELGFTKPGYFNQMWGGFRFDRDDTLYLKWQDTGYHSFLSFRVDCDIQEEADYAGHISKTRWETVVFENYAGQVATAPDLHYTQPASNGELLYWYTEEGKTYETADSKQFLPGETITGLRDGASLCAVPLYRDQVAFFANDKEFADGKRVDVTYGYCPSYTAKDGSQVLCWTTEPDGTGRKYSPGDWIDAGGVRLYAQWIAADCTSILLQNHTTNTTDPVTAEIGKPYALPTPDETPDGLKFLYWDCYYFNRDGEYQEIGRLLPGQTLTPTEDMNKIYAVACWLPVEQLIVDGTAYTITADQMKVSFADGQAEYNPYLGRFTVSLYGYHGGGISLPADAYVEIIGGVNTISGTLSCAGELSISEDCVNGSHPSLTITATDPSKPAILMKSLELGRLPHMTLTGGAYSKAITSPSGKWDSRVDIGSTVYYGKTSSTAAEIPVVEEEAGKRRGDMWQLRTEPVMCRVTLEGGGGTTANGETSVTVELERREVYDLHRAGFRKLHADLAGTQEAAGKGFYQYQNEMSIRPQAQELTLHLKWNEIGYPFIAFRTTVDTLRSENETGPGTNVKYMRNSDTLTVPELVFSDPASNGDLVYWYASEDSVQRADSHCYLPGEAVDEPDDTTLYAAGIYASQILLVANGTTFQNWGRITIATECWQIKDKDGREVESWNTKPDGTGKSYPIGTSALTIRADGVHVLYAQWPSAFETVVVKPDPVTGETDVTLKPKEDTTPPENTSDDTVKFEEARRVILAAYQDGKFRGMVFAKAIEGKIYCTIPRWLDYEKCELKLFFMDGGKPTRPMEIIRIRSGS